MIHDTWYEVEIKHTLVWIEEGMKKRWVSENSGRNDYVTKERWRMFERESIIPILRTTYNSWKQIHRDREQIQNGKEAETRKVAIKWFVNESRSSPLSLSSHKALGKIIIIQSINSYFSSFQLQSSFLSFKNYYFIQFFGSISSYLIFTFWPLQSNFLPLFYRF